MKTANEIALDAIATNYIDNNISILDIITRTIEQDRAEREREMEELKERLEIAERALEWKGYRRSCSIPACNCGDTWAHGGFAEIRLEEIAYEVWENGKTVLDSVKGLKNENSKLREALRPFVSAWEGLKQIQQGSDAYVKIQLKDYRRAAEALKEETK